ncbi:MAG TPA: hypothetical protein VLA72_16880 [Anaerolineales bacterium]|nr:hypothetical protein [Anaerolineales bacterium]
MAILTLSTLACRPILTIGWGEFLIVTVVIVVLIGPPVYRFIRRLESSRRKKDK